MWLGTCEERPGAPRLQLSGLWDSVYPCQTKQAYLNDPAHFSRFVRFNDFNFTTLQASVTGKGPHDIWTLCPLSHTFNL